MVWCSGVCTPACRIGGISVGVHAVAVMGSGSTGGGSTDVVLLLECMYSEHM